MRISASYLTPRMEWKKLSGELEKTFPKLSPCNRLGCRTVILISLSSWKPWKALGIERACERIVWEMFCCSPTYNIHLLYPMPCEVWNKPQNYFDWFFILVSNFVTDSPPPFDGWVPEVLNIHSENTKILSHNDPTFFVLYCVQSLPFFPLLSCLFTLPVMSSESLKDHPPNPLPPRSSSLTPVLITIALKRPAFCTKASHWSTFSSLPFTTSGLPDLSLSNRLQNWPSKSDVTW